MLYVVLGAIATIAGLAAWGALERKSKEKLKKELDVANKKVAEAEKRVANIKENVDKVLTYNSEDEEVKTQMDAHIKVLKDTRSKKGIEDEIEKLRGSVFNSIASL